MGKIPKIIAKSKQSPVCNRLIALVDVAERLVRAACRRGAPNLTPEQRKVLEYWLKEREKLEELALSSTADRPLCDACPLRSLKVNRNKKPKIPGKV